MNLSFSEKLILFLLSPPPLDKGQFKLSYPSWVDIQLNFYASCGIMMDLLADKKIDVANNEVRLVDKGSTGVEYKDEILKTIEKSLEQKTFNYWVNLFSDVNNDSKNKFNLYKKVEAQLLDKGLLFFKQSRYLLVLKSQEICSTNNGTEVINTLVGEIQSSVSNAMFNGSTLLLTILLGPDFADMLKYYLDRKQQDVLANLIANPSFKMDYAPIFFAADEITNAFYGRVCF